MPRLVLWSLILMLGGYGLSCLSTSYPPTRPPSTEEDKIEIAASPVLPPTWTGIQLAEPPFVQPAAEDQRQLNYWLMDKRIVTLPFNLFSSGFSLAVYTFFILLSDIARVQIGFFRTLGQNALAAYVLHEMVGGAVGSFAPKDSPLWWVAATFAVYVAITYLFVRHLEKHNIFIRM